MQEFIEKYMSRYLEEETEFEELRYLKPDSGKEIETDLRSFENMKKFIRDRGYLRKLELGSICKFKYPGNTDWKKDDEKRVKEVTRKALSSDIDDQQKISELSDLAGVRTPTASAILTVVYPERYAIIDYRAVRSLLWKCLDLEEAREFYIGLGAFRKPGPRHYPWYMERVRSLAEETDHTPREIDMALWKFDKIKDGLAKNSF